LVITVLHLLHHIYIRARYSKKITGKEHNKTTKRRLMNKIVKILLTILTALIIAGAGFWSGTRFANNQAAASMASAAIAPPSSITASGGNTPSYSAPSNQSLPGFNGQRDSNRQGNDSTSMNQPGNTRSNMGRPQSNNSGPAMMPQGIPNNRMMIAGRSNNSMQGMGGMSISSLFMGGGMLLFGLLFPLGFAVLMVLGIIILYRMVRHKVGVPIISNAVCAKCGGVVQTGWKHCPYCGEMIA
jgi:hypothetical protein